MSTIEVIFLTSSVLTGLVSLMILAANPWRKINQAYLVAGGVSALWLLCVFMAIHSGIRKEDDSVRLWLKLINAIASFVPWSFSLVRISITEEGPLKHAIRRSWPWALAGGLLALLACSELYIPENSTPTEPKRGIGYPIHMSALAVLCILILVDAYKEMRACTGVRLLEIKFFTINICLSTLAILASFAAGSLFDFSPLRYAGPFVIIASFGLTLWAICYHRVFDARQVFAALGRQVSSLMMLALCVIAINASLSDRFSSPFSLIISAACAGLIAIYWDRTVSDWLGLDPKKILAGPRAQIIQYAREEADVGRLIVRFETFLQDWCRAESVTFHTAESSEPPSVLLKNRDYTRSFPFVCQEGYVTAETLSRRRPDSEISASKALLAERNARALIAVPRGSHSPSCVVTFGKRRSLRPYTYPDIQLLIELVELMDHILSQARVATRTAQIEKMESAAMMSRGLAHDLNNLATPVSTFLMHMEDRVKPGSPEAEVLADAKHSIRVMQDYIRESLLFARSLKPNFEQVSAREFVASTIKLTHSRAEFRGVALTTGNVVDAAFRADRALMQRLLQNLILNGIDATPSGGKVTVYAEIPSPNRIAISVADEGPGVPADLKDIIFEPYFTTKDTGDEIRGLGLGLAICLKISGLHGGEIDVGRAASGGAVFRVSLPLAPNP